MDRRTCRAGHNADGAGVFGELFLFVRVKKALLRQFLFGLLEGRIQVAYAVYGHGGAVQLILSVSWVDCHAAQGDDLHAICGPKPQPHGASLKHHAL